MTCCRSSANIVVANEPDKIFFFPLLQFYCPGLFMDEQRNERRY